MNARVIRRISAGALGSAVAVWVCGAGLMRSVHAPSDVVLAQAPAFAVDDLWLAPSTDAVVPSELARAVAMIPAGRAEDAIPVLVRATGDPDLGGYAQMYLGRAYLATGKTDRAINAARLILERSTSGALGEAALWMLGDASMVTGNWVDAVAAYDALTKQRISSPSLAYMRLGQAAERAGDESAARAAYAKVYYDLPLSSDAQDADVALTRLGRDEVADRDARESKRAETLFAARRYADARKAFEALRGRANGDDRWRLDLRLAQCDVGLRRFAAARDALRSYLASAPGSHDEAAFAYLTALRGLNRDDEYVAAVWQFVADHPGAPLAESALNDLGTYYILANDDAKAADVFARMFAAFPSGAFADRAAWRAGWWAYKSGNPRETIRLFESAAVTLRRSDYRPSWLYWTARSYEAIGAHEEAVGAYRGVIADYRNSYYGREAARALNRLGADRAAVLLASARREPALAIAAGTPPASAPLIQRLLAVGLYDDAIAEVQKAKLETGTSPLLDATLAYALNRKGDLRGAITAMRRAYPQFMADGGEALPREILRVIFPVAHWDLIRRSAEQHRLDPFLVAALVAQESTFQADVRSGANAWGLMQIVPATGRRYAPKVGVRRFSTSKLTDPDVNVRIGTAYLADLIGEFNDVASALAAYNAGESRVSRWRAERPGIARDEFIDDIPFPETQNYVKRIIGTAEDYRMLYGAGQMAAVSVPAR
jgi:soluble lytic murein transglycosylase